MQCPHLSSSSIKLKSALFNKRQALPNEWECNGTSHRDLQSRDCDSCHKHLLIVTFFWLLITNYESCLIFVVCKTRKSPWLCLHCGIISCGRYINGHAKSHYNDSGHFLCVDCNSYAPFWYVSRLTFVSINIFWINFWWIEINQFLSSHLFSSYVCDDYVINDTRSRHIHQLRSKLLAGNE